MVGIEVGFSVVTVVTVVVVVVVVVDTSIQNKGICCFIYMTEHVLQRRGQIYNRPTANIMNTNQLCV